MSDRATKWSITINNPIERDEENISKARQQGWSVEGQKEVGENGTEHYQLLVDTKKQQRFAAMKKAFPRAHIEVCRNVAALKKYVHKEETRVAELMSDNEQYPSLQKLWDLFYKWLLDNNHDWRYGSYSQQRWLDLFDKFIENAIQNGYVVETMAVNPQIRSCIKNYGYSIMWRSFNRIEDLHSNGGEPRRQTDEDSVADTNITEDV